MARNKKNKQPKNDFRIFHATRPTHIIDEDGCIVDDAQVDRMMLELIDMIVHLNETEQEMYTDKFPQVIDAMDDDFVYLTMPFIDWDKYDPENTKRQTAPTKRYTLVFRIPNKPFFHEDGLKPCAPDVIYRCDRRGPYLDFAIALMRPNTYADYDKKTCVAVDSGIARKATFGLVHIMTKNEFAISTTLFTSRKIQALEARNEHRKVNIESLKRLIADDAYFEDYDALRVHENELTHVYARMKSTKCELNRQYAYAIVSLAYLARGYVALEELSWSDSHHDWDRAELEKEVRVIAARFGVPVKSVNPAFTSQSCPVCAGELSFDAATRVVSCVNSDYVADRDDTGELNIGVFSLLEENGVKARHRAKRSTVDDAAGSVDKEEESDDAGALLCYRSFVSYSLSDFSIDRLVKRGVRASTGRRKPLPVRQINQILGTDGPDKPKTTKTGLPSHTRK